MQLDQSTAQLYEDFVVKAMMREWAGYAADYARCEDGHDVLDLACGTGMVSRTIRDRADVRLIGVDQNPSMLEVARRLEPSIEWVEGSAESLPFENDSFDRVICQYGLMFFEEQIEGIREMMRVVRPGGRCVVSTWESLACSPVFRVTADLLRSHFGHHDLDDLDSPFSLGDPERLLGLFERAGVSNVRIHRQMGWARFPGVRELFENRLLMRIGTIEIEDGHRLESMVEEGEELLNEYVRAGGQLEFERTSYFAIVQS